MDGLPLTLCLMCGSGDEDRCNFRRYECDYSQGGMEMASSVMYRIGECDLVLRTTPIEAWYDPVAMDKGKWFNVTGLANTT